MTHFDLGIHCDYLVSMARGEGKVLRNQFIGITGHQIALIAPWDSGPFSIEKLIEAKNQIVLPGLINGHTHLAMNLFRGVADDLPFHEWLNKYIFPLEAKMVDATFVEVGTELAALECIRAGVTTICDMYYFSSTVAHVLDRAGLRGIVCEAVADFPAPDDKQQNGENYKILDKMIHEFKNHSRIYPGIGPHAPYSCSDETLKKAKAYADKNKIPFVIHVSETREEVAESLKKFGKSPVKRLYDLGIMGPSTVFAHCVHVNDEDIQLLKETKTGVINNPESNMKLGSGVAPVPLMLREQVYVGLGTDGAASNNDLNIFREMDSAAKIQKVSHNDNSAMTARQALNMATLGGAQALNLEDLIGSLEVGKRADIICVDLMKIGMRPVFDVISQLVYSSSGQEVETVICDGKILMDKGQIKTLEMFKIFSKVDLIRDRIQASLPKSILS